MLARVAALAALGGFLFGYDLGLIGGAMLGISQAFNITRDSTREAVVGAAKLGAFFGTFIGGVLMLRYGRRLAIAAESGFFVVGPLVMALATGPAALVVGRLVVGLGIGASAIVVPAYLAEIAPAASRGAVVQTYEVMLTLGMLSAGVVDWALSAAVGPSAWRWMVGLPALPGALLVLSLLLLPESPRWLVMRGQLDLALQTLHTITASSSSSNSSSTSVGGRLGLGSAAGDGSGAADPEARALAQAEDELLLLWSSVQKEQAAGLELRQQAHAAAAAAGTATAAAGTATAAAGAPPQMAAAGAGPVTQAAALQDTGSSVSHCSSSCPTVEIVAAAAGTAAAGPAFARSPAAAGVFTLEEEEAGIVGPAAAGANNSQPKPGKPSGSPRRLHLQHQHQQQWADDSQFEQLLSPNDISSTDDGPHPAAAGIAAAAAAGGGSSSHSSWQPQGPAGLAAWVKGWLRGRQGFRGLPVGSTLAAGRPAAAAAATQQQQCQPGQEPSLAAALWAMLCDVAAVARGPERAAFGMAAALAVFDQASASTAVINYAPQVLQAQLGVADTGSAILYPALISVAKCVGVGLALLLVDRLGRKPLLVWGGVGCGLALAAAALALTAGSVPLFLACLCLFIFCFSCSWAGLYWVVVSEVFSMAAKSPATSAATSLLFLTGAAVNFVFLSLVAWLGPGAFVLFAAVAFGSAAYVWRAVPETKGRTLAEVQAMLAAPTGAGGGGPTQQQQQQQQQQQGRDGSNGLWAARPAAGAGGGWQAMVGQAGSAEWSQSGNGAAGGQQPSPSHSPTGAAADDEGHHAWQQQSGHYWQSWLQRQQRQQGSQAAGGLALPLGMELTAPGSRPGSRRQQQQMQQRQPGTEASETSLLRGSV